MHCFHLGRHFRRTAAQISPVVPAALESGNKLEFRALSAYLTVRMKPLIRKQAHSFPTVHITSGTIPAGISTRFRVEFRGIGPISNPSTVGLKVAAGSVYPDRISWSGSRAFQIWNQVAGGSAPLRLNTPATCLATHRQCLKFRRGIAHHGHDARAPRGPKPCNEMVASTATVI